MSRLAKIRAVAEFPGMVVQAGAARALAQTSKAPRFCGIYPSREAALEAIPKSALSGYDHSEIAEVSLEQMSQRSLFDYPIAFWLTRLLPESPAVVDVGGHFGTKYIALRDLVDLEDVSWSVVDLPQIIEAAKTKQLNNELPAPIQFLAEYPNSGNSSILIASGLFQYYDRPLSELLESRPKHVLMNKIAVTAGKSFFTLERIGNARVPYQVRNKDLWRTEVENCGYEIVDTWQIPSISHKISTHPWRPASQSFGMYVRRS